MHPEDDSAWSYLMPASFVWKGEGGIIHVIIGEVVEQVVGLFRLAPPAAATEYEVDPAVQVGGHVGALQRLGQLLHEIVRI